MVDKLELKINKWLDNPIDELNTNQTEVINDNMRFCEQYVSDVIDIVKNQTYQVLDEKQLRDDIIEIIYNYSHDG